MFNWTWNETSMLAKIHFSVPIPYILLGTRFPVLHLLHFSNNRTYGPKYTAQCGFTGFSIKPMFACACVCMWMGNYLLLSVQSLIGAKLLYQIGGENRFRGIWPATTDFFRTSWTYPIYLMPTSWIGRRKGEKEKDENRFHGISYHWMLLRFEDLFFSRRTGS